MSQRLYELLRPCLKEEEVKAECSKYFKFKINAKRQIDHYTTQILYEFKYNKNFLNKHILSSVISQTLYYIRFLKYGQTTDPIPPYICLFDKEYVSILETAKYKGIYEKNTFDWDRSPSTPDPKIIEAVEKTKFTSELHVYSLADVNEESQFILTHKSLSATQLSLFTSEKKCINEDNFLDSYQYWNKLFGKYVENGKKASEYFISDIEYGKSNKFGDNRIAFDLGDGNARLKEIPLKDYEYFWSLYEKIDNPSTIYSIRQKIDRISENYMRRFTGEFYTPVEFADKALKYLEKATCENWWETGKYRLWDMAAGTGNLEFNLPSSALQYCYISTLLEDDANYCQRIFPESTCFQYDFLNDDVELLINKNLSQYGIKPKMPKKLIDDLNNPEIIWIIFINPPFVTANESIKEIGKESKKGVSNASIREIMTKEDLGEVSRELFSQFLYRISLEFSNKIAYLGLFSKIKYLNSNNDQKLRDTFFRHKFLDGFILPSKCFSGNKGNFPVGFLIWKLSANKSIEDQKIILDVFNEKVEKYGTKKIVNDNRTSFLSKWPKRYSNTLTLPAFSSAITVTEREIDVRDTVPNGFLCSFMCCGNDFQHVNQTALLSSPQASAGSYSVVKDNFDQSMIIHTVRRLPKPSWTNDRDQFYQPNTLNLPKEFILDCIIWSVFSDSNNTVSMKDVKYKGNVYQINNNLFPYPLSLVKNWRSDLQTINNQIFAAKEERFLADYFLNKQLSPESNAVFELGKNLYEYFYANITKSHWKEYRIESWDVGLWQIRKAVTENGTNCEELNKLKASHLLLGKKIMPQLYSFGFIPEDVVEFETI